MWERRTIRQNHRAASTRCRCLPEPGLLAPVVGWGGGGEQEEGEEAAREGSTTGSGLGGGSRCWGRVGEAVTERRTQESNFSRFHLLQSTWETERAGEVKGLHSWAA